MEEELKKEVVNNYEEFRKLVTRINLCNKRDVELFKGVPIGNIERDLQFVNNLRIAYNQCDISYLLNEIIRVFNELMLEGE